MFHSSHEIPTDESTRRTIWNATGIPGRSADHLDELQMSTVWLDFFSSKKTVHQWIVRRWNAFNVSANIVAGILLCWGLRLTFPETRHAPQGWWVIGLVGLLVFFQNALIAHGDTMRMLKFAADKIAAQSSNPPTQGRIERIRLQISTSID